MTVDTSREGRSHQHASVRTRHTRHQFLHQDFLSSPFYIFPLRPQDCPQLSSTYPPVPSYKTPQPQAVGRGFPAPSLLRPVTAAPVRARAGAPTGEEWKRADDDSVKRSRVIHPWARANSFTTAMEPFEAKPRQDEYSTPSARPSRCHPLTTDNGASRSGGPGTSRRNREVWWLPGF